MSDVNIIYGYSIWVLMGSVNISIKDEAYRFLKSIKGKKESFSDAILRFKDQERNISRFFGVLKDSDWSSKEKRMKAFRESFEERL